MQKRLTLAIALILPLASLTVNAFSDSAITVWVPADKGYDGIIAMGSRFERETGIKVNVRHPDSIEVKFLQIAATGGGPDIIIFAHDRFGEYAQARLIREITVNNDFKAKFESLTWDALKYKGKYFGYPIATEALSLIYNKELISEPMKNWEDVFAIDETLSAENKKAIMWDLKSPYYTWPLLAANGGYAFKETADGYDTKDIGVNNKGTRRSMSFVKTLVDRAIISADSDYVNAESAFIHGKVAMTLNGPWSWANLDKSGVNYELAILPKLNGHPSRPFVGVLSAGINSNSPNAALAVEFLENYLLTDIGLRLMNAHVPLGAPALKSFLEELSGDQRVLATITNARAGEIMPNIPQMMPFWYGLQSAITNVIQQRQSIEDALSTVEKRMLK
jgi:maltose/maltodextrin transport system substrate-binding protein